MAQQQGPDGSWHWVNEPALGAGPVPPAANPGAPTKKKRRRWPWVIVALLVGFILIGVLAPKPPEASPAADTTPAATPTATTAPITAASPTATAPTTTLPRTTSTTAPLPPATTPPVGEASTTVETPHVETQRYTPQPTTETPSVPPPTFTPPTARGESAYYANCDAAKAAGVAPIFLGEPGYRPGLDRDGDGIACDKP